MLNVFSRVLETILLLAAAYLAFVGRFDETTHYFILAGYLRLCRLEDKKD